MSASSVKTEAAGRKAALFLAVQGVGRSSAGGDEAALEPGLSRRVRLLPLGDVHPDDGQPRRCFDEEAIERLPATIRTAGVLSPIVVAPRDEGGVTIVLGERRWRAAARAGLAEVPTLALGVLGERERLELQLLENVAREDLNVVEEGRGYARLVALGASQREIAERVGRSEASVSRALAIATRLPEAWLAEAEARPELRSPSKLYELAQAADNARAALWERFRQGASRAAIERAAGASRRRGRGLAPALRKEVDALLRRLRRARKDVDRRRVNRRALVAFALRRLAETWDGDAEEAFFRSI